MSDRDTLVRRLAMGGVVLSATVLSYSTLHHRALVIGIPEWAAWFYPVLYDAFILGASRMWQNHALTSTTRKLAKWATLGGIAAAIAAFVIEFAPRGPAATFGALMIPAVMAWALVLTSRAAADRKAAQKPAAKPQPEPVSVVPVVAPEPVAAKVEGIPTKTIEFEPVTTADKRTWVHEQLDLGVDVTGAMIDKKFGGRNGSRLIRSVREERASRNGSNRIEVTT